MVSANEELIKNIMDKVRPLIYDTQAEIIRNTPVDTGRLRNSIIVEERDDGFIIGTTVTYAEDVEVGTKPHIIRPVNKKALKFVIGGETIFAKEVNHPGTEGSHMFLKGVTFFERGLKALDLD